VRSPPDGYTLLLVGSPNAVKRTCTIDSISISSAHCAGCCLCAPRPMVVHPFLPGQFGCRNSLATPGRSRKISMASGGIGMLATLWQLFKNDDSSDDATFLIERKAAISDLGSAFIQRHTLVIEHIRPAHCASSSNYRHPLGLLPDTPTLPNSCRIRGKWLQGSARRRTRSQDNR